MNLVPATYLENVKRYWRRRGYQRLDETTQIRKRVKIKKLGRKTRRAWEVNRLTKLQFKRVSPLKIVEKIYKPYVNMMIHLGGEKAAGPSRGRKTLMTRDEEMDGRVILEICNKLLASRELDLVNVKDFCFFFFNI
ncbi:hypothetical protein NMG60_11020553 [Bertholletia excelsa]